MTEKIAQNKKGKAAKEKELGAGGKYQKDEEVALPGSAQKQGEAERKPSEEPSRHYLLREHMLEATELESQLVKARKKFLDRLRYDAWVLEQNQYEIEKQLSELQAVLTSRNKNPVPNQGGQEAGLRDLAAEAEVARTRAKLEESEHSRDALESEVDALKRELREAKLEIQVEVGASAPQVVSARI